MIGQLNEKLRSWPRGSGSWISPKHIAVVLRIPGPFGAMKLTFELYCCYPKDPKDPPMEG